MSAICGIVRTDGAPVSRAELAGMLAALARFGADSFSWTPETADAPVGLGCRVLRITAEDGWYHPPLRSPDGRLVLVADARIDNREELRSELGLERAEADQLPDAAFILAAYRAWGIETARHLLGDFAFALWDQQYRRLYCARDGMGIRVLYCHATPHRFAFATAPYALIALEGVRPRLNQQKVAESLVLFQDPESTFFAGVNRLLPGHWMTVTADGTRTERYWTPQPTRSIEFRSDREYVEGFTEVFDRAVATRVRSAGKVGILLSGGLDSTAIAASAADQLGGQGLPLHAFHAAPRIGFGSGERRGWVADETAEVEAVAGRYANIDLWIHRSDGRSPFDSDRMLFQTAGLPPRNPNNLPWFEAIYHAARDQGVNVLLSGNQGNPTISYDGLRSLRDMARRGHWGVVWQEVRAFAGESGKRPRDVFTQQVLLPLLPEWLTPGSSEVRNLEQAADAVTRYSAIHPDFARTTGVQQRVLDNGEDGARVRRAGGLEYRISALNSPADSPDLANGCRAWFGIETREPATDRRVVEYCLSIPETQYLRQGRTRWLLRRAMQGRLPDRVLDRKTRGSQAADWSEWIPGLLGEIGAELDRLEHSDTARSCLDLPRMRSLVANCPVPLQPRDRRTYVHLLLRGVTMGRFIRWFEETYS
jgi:asparagine synthase (glutamine-hydrolysing)